MSQKKISFARLILHQNEYYSTILTAASDEIQKERLGKVVIQDDILLCHMAFTVLLIQNSGHCGAVKFTAHRS